MRRFVLPLLSALALAAPAAAAPARERLVLDLECLSLAPIEAARHADCHSASIMTKKAFFDSPLPVRLASPKAGEVRPLLELHLLMYRKALPRPMDGEGVYEWRYRGLALWRVLDPQGGSLAGGVVDVDSGREFAGGASGGPDPSRLRGQILRPLVRQLPERVYGALKAVGVTPGEPLPAGRAEEVEVRLRGKPTGVCAERFAREADQAMLEATLGASVQAMLAAPELSEAAGPWQATVFACTDAPEIRLRLRGKTLKAEAACVLEEPLTLSGPEGIAAQCAQSLATELRTTLLQAEHDQK